MIELIRVVSPTFGAIAYINPSRITALIEQEKGITAIVLQGVDAPLNIDIPADELAAKLVEADAAYLLNG